MTFSKVTLIKATVFRMTLSKVKRDNKGLSSIKIGIKTLNRMAWSRTTR